MRPFRQPLVAAAALAFSLSACGPQESVQSPSSAVEDARTPEQAEAERTPYELDAAFARAGQDFQVPAELLKGIAYAETRFEMIQGHQEFEGMPAASGLMALRGDNLTEGARLAGVSVEEARTQPEANIRAAAALLSQWAQAEGIVREDVGAWAPVVVKLSGITNPEAQAQYVHREVYGVMRSGVVAQTPAGGVAVSLLPTEVQAKFASPSVHAMAAGPDYASSIWRASPNYNARPSGSGGGVQIVVIHTCEGSYSSCWSWLTNSASGVSAHYVVNESGSEISQLVRESSRGWHVGANYSPSLNGGVLSNLSGTSVNNFAVGIEHGGSASQSSFPAGQIEASAKLTCNIAKDNGITIDSYHIVAHGKLQPASRTDPGPNWPWSSYISKVKGYCGSGGTTPPPSGGLIIDSNNANNDEAKGYVEMSGSWARTTSTAGYYGSDYYYASTQAISDPATFYFYASAAGTKTIDAWWTAGTNRSPAAPFIFVNAAGTTVATPKVNQQVGGGAWNTIGTFAATAGWNKVQLSRWATEGYVVVADAIRVR
ncbi:N-acetylmuramoyl-L-alanine amidase [Melittangium boletus]|uniref:N-acetylmuramoyl-L-alanine amidase n=1 Tax=Melittangium boletus DSM 14713 TaxID=1294270 RepID=A0A250IGI8_9BACT|nr:N-acetylmuramoyl-L-alanine amidase [Melittangium boletus]ATB30333.1 Negative regulator of beta-lactamase expression [Melittangium boletus DSM 14713]